MQSAMGAKAIGNKAPSGESSDAFPAPALAILHSPCGMRFDSDPKRGPSLVLVRCGCQLTICIPLRRREIRLPVAVPEVMVLQSNINCAAEAD